MARPRQVDPGALALRLKAKGPLTAQMLAAALHVNRSSVSRGLALPEISPQLVKLGTTRGATYALRRSVRGIGDTFPVRRIDASGRAHDWAQLVAMHGGWQVVWADSPGPFHQLSGLLGIGGYAEGFPFFLSELRPQGFLGRAIGRVVSSTLNLPPDPRGWDDDDTLVYLQAAGDNLPGDLIVGDGPLARFHRRIVDNLPGIAAEDRVARYPELATAATSSSSAGSSVEGEQPKFLLPIQEGDTITQVLVKFTDSLATATGRRWADLLVAEAHAQAIFHRHGECHAVPRLIDAGDRRFLESPRYDRVGAHGRLGVVSLRSLHDAFSGRDANQWPAAAAHLHASGLIDAGALRSIRLRHAFGQLIGNSDMHFGNLAFWSPGNLPFRLAPAYDMLPMLWAPTVGSATPYPEFSPPVPLPAERAIWSEAAAWAVELWRRVNEDERVSAEFAAVARASGAVVARLRQHFGA